MVRHCCYCFAIVLLAACAPAPEPESRGAAFACGDFLFSVRFQHDTATVALPRDTLQLPIAISASGARYSDGRQTYWEHQGKARLELTDTTYVDCERVQR